MIFGNMLGDYSIQCHERIDMWKHRTRRGLTIATPGLRIWAGETMLEDSDQILSDETGASIKKFGN